MCDHEWVGGIMVVHDEDAAAVNAERLANGRGPLECNNCGKEYPG